MFLFKKLLSNAIMLLIGLVLLIRQMVGDDKVLLVTSASHRPRAVGLFRLAGLL